MVREPARTFRDLEVWSEVHGFVLGVCQFTSTFPKHELYGLAAQMRRAAVSVPANIAEGFRRRGKADKLRFLNIAERSLEECRYYLILSSDVEYGNMGELNVRLERVSKLLNAYCRAIPASDSRLPPHD